MDPERASDYFRVEEETTPSDFTRTSEKLTDLKQLSRFNFQLRTSTTIEEKLADLQVLAITPSPILYRFMSSPGLRTIGEWVYEGCNNIQQNAEVFIKIFSFLKEIQLRSEYLDQAQHLGLGIEKLQLVQQSGEESEQIERVMNMFSKFYNLNKTVISEWLEQYKRRLNDPQFKKQLLSSEQSRKRPHYSKEYPSNKPSYNNSSYQKDNKNSSNFKGSNNNSSSKMNRTDSPPTNKKQKMNPPQFSGSSQAQFSKDSRKKGVQFSSENQVKRFRKEDEPIMGDMTDQEVEMYQEEQRKKREISGQLYVNAQDIRSRENKLEKDNLFQLKESEKKERQILDAMKEDIPWRTPLRLKDKANEYLERISEHSQEKEIHQKRILCKMQCLYGSDSDIPSMPNYDCIINDKQSSEDPQQIFLNKLGDIDFIQAIEVAIQNQSKENLKTKVERKALKSILKRPKEEKERIRKKMLEEKRKQADEEERMKKNINAGVMQKLIDLIMNNKKSSKDEMIATVKSLGLSERELHNIYQNINLIMYVMKNKSPSEIDAASLLPQPPPTNSKFAERKDFLPPVGPGPIPQQQGQMGRMQQVVLPPPSQQIQQQPQIPGAPYNNQLRVQQMHIPQSPYPPPYNSHGKGYQGQGGQSSQPPNFQRFPSNGSNNGMNSNTNNSNYQNGQPNQFNSQQYQQQLFPQQPQNEPYNPNIPFQNFPQQGQQNYGSYPPNQGNRNNYQNPPNLQPRAPQNGNFNQPFNNNNNNNSSNNSNNSSSSNNNSNGNNNNNNPPFPNNNNNRRQFGQNNSNTGALTPPYNNQANNSSYSTSNPNGTSIKPQFPQQSQQQNPQKPGLPFTPAGSSVLTNSSSVNPLQLSSKPAQQGQPPSQQPPNQQLTQQQQQQLRGYSMLPPGDERERNQPCRMYHSEMGCKRELCFFQHIPQYQGRPAPNMDKMVRPMHALSKNPERNLENTFAYNRAKFEKKSNQLNTVPFPSQGIPSSQQQSGALFVPNPYQSSNNNGLGNNINSNNGNSNPPLGSVNVNNNPNGQTALNNNNGNNSSNGNVNNQNNSNNSIGNSSNNNNPNNASSYLGGGNNQSGFPFVKQNPLLKQQPLS